MKSEYVTSLFVSTPHRNSKQRNYTIVRIPERVNRPERLHVAVGEFGEVPGIQPCICETANEAIQKDAPVKNSTLTAGFFVPGSI